MPPSLSGYFVRTFLSDPIRLVKSYIPLPLPSPSIFSQTLNETPQLVIAPTRSFKYLLVLCDGGLFKLSFVSHSIAFVITFSVSSSKYKEHKAINNLFLMDYLSIFQWGKC